MSPADDVAAVLAAKAAAVDAEIAELTTPMADAGQIQFGKRAGDATNVAAEQLARVGTVEQLAVLRDEIGHAQASLAAGTYGTCERCGTAIAHERLEALPWATTCVGCAQVSGQRRSRR